MQATVERTRRRARARDIPSGPSGHEAELRTPLGTLTVIVDEYSKKHGPRYLFFRLPPGEASRVVHEVDWGDGVA